MKMKKYIFTVAAVIVSIAAIVSCAKEGLDFFRGVYGYVTGGSLTCVCLDEGASTDPIECQIASERGIIRIDADSRGAILTMSSIVGDALVFDAQIEGTDITLSPQKRMVTLSVESRSVTIPVTVQGGGHKTGDIVVLNLEYDGDVFSIDDFTGSHSYDITGSSVTCIATLQD